MQKVSLIQLHKEVERLKKSVNVLTKRASRQELIIIERIDDKMLNSKQKKLMKEALSDLKHNRKGKFISLDRLKKRYM